MNEAERQVKQFFQNDLPYIGEKIIRCGVIPQGGKRRPVDCVAFSASSVSLDGKDAVIDYHHAICSHPKRGKQYGCLLTKEVQGGTVRRVVGRTCRFRVKVGRRGSAGLIRTMREKEDQFPL